MATTFDSSKHLPEEPADYVRSGWAVVRDDPFLLVWKALVDIGGYVVQFVAMATLVLAASIHLGSHLARGGDLLGWISELGNLASRPAVLIGALGVLFAAWLVSFTLQACVYAGIWGTITHRLCGARIRPLTTFFTSVSGHFPEAVTLRSVLVVANVALAMLLASVAVPLSMLTPRLAEATDSAVLVPAAVWATSLTVYGALALLVRISVEMLAPALFLDRVGLGEAIFRAARLVAANLGELYRIFVTAAAILIPGLLMYWFAIILQNVAFEIPELASLATTIRFAAELVLIATVAGFVVILHAAFFVYYAVATGLVEDVPSPPRLRWTRWLSAFGSGLKSAERATPPPTLGDLLPEELPWVADLDEVLEGAEELPPARPEPEAAEEPEQEEQVAEIVGDSPRPFDLDAILRPKKDDETQED